MARINRKSLSSLYILLSVFCSVSFAQKNIIESSLTDSSSFYFIDFKHYPQKQKSLPIGIFDSGTGGLTVMNAVLALDQFQNQSKEKGADGKRDFLNENFIYLADQANMPYGNYNAEGKTDLLKEHIIKDAQFLLGSKYYTETGELKQDKSPIKALVVACNTATAYGKEYIEEYLQKGRLDMKVIGVIDAGAKAALAQIGPHQKVSVGIFATAGTVASKGYDKALRQYEKLNPQNSIIDIYAVGGVGLAEAIDQVPEYIDLAATKPRESYRGPGLNASLLIDKQLMKIYNFDFADYKMLCDAKKVDDCSQLQINSAENYVRYHLVSLLENMKQQKARFPLSTLILGCTHYPYVKEHIKKVLEELYNYKENNTFRYRDVLAAQVSLIDPAFYTAVELYDYLKQEDLFDKNPKTSESKFFITVPNTSLAEVKTDQTGGFTYAYKYGRMPHQNIQTTLAVPFSKNNINHETMLRFETLIPAVFPYIKATF